MGCAPSMLSDSNTNRKNSNLFCTNTGSNNSTNTVGNGTDVGNHAICNQILVSQYGSKGDCGPDMVSTIHVLNFYPIIFLNKCKQKYNEVFFFNKKKKLK